MKKTILFLFLTYFILGCATTKNTADIEDVWKRVEYVDELLGDWQTSVLLEDGKELITTFSFIIDKNKDCIFIMTVDLEPMFDNLSSGDINEKDKLWEYFLIDREKNEDDDIFTYSYGKYFTEATFTYVKNEDRNKKIDDEIFINQFGNKIRQNNSYVLSLPENMILEKVKKPKRRTKDR